MEGIPAAPDTWLSAIRRYLAVIAVGNLLWEFAHMPLYTLWRTGTVGEIVSAALHCTGGDVLIATAALVLALVVVGSSAWPRERFLPVAVAAMALGLGYTAFSEWLNIGVRRAWPYSDLMPVLAWFGMALSSVSVVGNALRLRTAKL
jgi:hypothetical protein